MKSTIVIFVLFYACYVNASLKIGDSAGYITKISHSDGVIETQRTRETILKIDGDLLVVLNEILNEKGEVIDSYKSKKELSSQMDKEAASHILSQCQTEGFGGTIESVTVPAGTFEACRLGNATGSMWFSSVVFGYVKISAETKVKGANGTSENVLYTRELVSTFEAP